jgi:hypothetical protein
MFPKFEKWIKQIKIHKSDNELNSWWEKASDFYWNSSTMTSLAKVMITQIIQKHNKNKLKFLQK